MDLDTIVEVVSARSRADLTVVGPKTQVLAGGTWLFSEPQDHLNALVDITTLEWPALMEKSGGLEISATCTLAELVEREYPASWAATPLFRQCCSALLASEKIWNTATVGGNICLSLPAGAIISLLAALDATATVWAPDGTDYDVRITDLVTGAGTNTMRSGDILRSIAIPGESLCSTTAFRKVALAPLGRSGAVVIGRRSPKGTFVLTVTAATTRPVQLRFDAMPNPDEIATALAGVEVWFDDPHGSPDWRRHVSNVLAQEVLAELR